MQPINSGPLAHMQPMNSGPLPQLGLSGGWEVMMILAVIGLWILAVVAVVSLVRGGLRFSFRRPSTPTPQAASSLATAPEPALDMLKRRYASGEIDKAEFDTKKNDLTQ